jgi:methylase of polypeptide subunit release factors
VALTGSARRLAGKLLAGTSRVVGDENYRTVVDRLHREVYPDGFSVRGIHYYPDPCSVGLTAGGEVTGASAADLIRERGMSGLHVLDICCGVGLVGLTLLACLKDDVERRVHSMSLADINIFNLNSIERTLQTNPAERWGDVPVRTYLTDGLKHITPANQFDLIVSNPPHFFLPSFSDVRLQPDVLGTNDAGWKFHNEFYAVAVEYLSPGGQVWFLENHLAESDDQLIQMAKDAAGLELVDVFDDRRESTLFWVMTRRQPPASGAGPQPTGPSN